jgi:hypothetical protein
MNKHKGQPGPYLSARDLPSVAEMLEQIRGMKLLTRFVARSERQKVLEIEKQIEEHVAVVDRFYELLGDRHWIFHDSLNLETVKALLSLQPEEAERAFIDIYRDPEAFRFMTMSLRRFPAMRDRIELVDKAVRDYRDDRFYACVLVLLTVMDGFVNDLDPARRRGLHTREPDELAAWDTVVGHHLGLTNAHSTFTKGTYKTSTEPVFELQRHGIVHGMLLNYDNIVVATKAWNRLFAVADWATSIENKNKPREPEPWWGEIIRQISRNEAGKKALAEWQPRKLAATDPDFYDEEVCNRAKTYLDGWKRRNYGAMAALISAAVGEGTPSATARMVRGEFESWNLDDYTFLGSEFEAAAACEINVDLVIDGEVQHARMRWIREDADGMAAVPNEDGTWYLYLWEPWALLNRAERSGGNI